MTKKLGLLVFLDRIDRDNVVVLKARHGTRFPQEPLHKGGVPAEMGMHEFDGHDPIQGAVERPVDDAHPATGDLILHHIFAGEDLGGHRCSRTGTVAVGYTGSRESTTGPYGLPTDGLPQTT